MYFQKYMLKNISYKIEMIFNIFSHRIEHVGSTSVPGLASKPVVDLDVVVAAGDVNAAVAAIEALGYEHRGDMGIEGRHRLRCDITIKKTTYTACRHRMAHRK